MNVRMLAKPFRIRQAVLNFTGWPDAGRVVSSTLAEMRALLPCEPAAEWDLDGYWNADALRPEVKVSHGQIRKLEWPTCLFHLCRPPGNALPILAGEGPEPGTRWRGFVSELLQGLRSWGCEELILPGSVYDDVFHDEIVISGTVQDVRGINQMKELECRQIEYSGPGAIQSAIMELSPSFGIRCLGIRAHFPFYLKAPHELLMARLLGILGSLLGVEFDTGRLLNAWQKRSGEIAEMIQQDQDLRQVLDSLKKEDRGLGPVHGKSKVVRFEEFLKKRNGPTEPEGE
ncbi:MAG: PAC2 family protein [Syntrophobacteraceae bacterium]|nr:PAC2 family protein [Desulfobacteraceae bacterium]